MNTSMAYVAAFLMMLTSVSGFAAVKPDKVVEKARAAVSAASPDDWETYAKSAQMCIKKKVNLAEAKEWLDKSLSIKESPFALEVAGDYYMVNKLAREAITHYVKSMNMVKEKDFYANTSTLQEKINKAKLMQEKVG